MVITQAPLHHFEIVCIHLISAADSKLGHFLQEHIGHILIAIIPFDFGPLRILFLPLYLLEYTFEIPPTPPPIPPELVLAHSLDRPHHLLLKDLPIFFYSGDFDLSVFFNLVVVLQEVPVGDVGAFEHGRVVAVAPELVRAHKRADAGTDVLF